MQSTIIGMAFVEKLFVLGPSSRIVDGVVSEADAAAWRRYWEREGQAWLQAPAEVRSLMNCRIEAPLVPDGPQPEYLLEHLDPELEDEVLFPDPLTWKRYFRDVYEMDVGTTEELVAAMEARGWPADEIARYRRLDLEDTIPAGSPEEVEHEQKMAEIVQQEDVYVGPMEGAFALVKQATEGFPETAEPESIVARIRFDPDTKGVRWVYALGPIAVTALQELLNALGAGVRLRFTREDDPPLWEPIQLDRP